MSKEDTPQRNEGTNEVVGRHAWFRKHVSFYAMFVALAVALTSYLMLNVAAPFNLFFSGAAVAFVLTLAYGTWVSSLFLRWRYPDAGVMGSRWVALVKQSFGFAFWAYFGSASMEAFFIDATRFYRWMHAIPCLIALYLMAFALLSHTFESPSPQLSARNAALWVVWDFMAISVPLFLIARLIQL